MAAANQMGKGFVVYNGGLISKEDRSGAGVGHDNENHLMELDGPASHGTDR